MKKHSGIENVCFPIIQLGTVQSTTQFNIFYIVLFFSLMHTQFKIQKWNSLGKLYINPVSFYPKTFLFINKKGMEEIDVLKNKKNRKESVSR